MAPRATGACTPIRSPLVAAAIGSRAGPLVVIISTSVVFGTASMRRVLRKATTTVIRLIGAARGAYRPMGSPVATVAACPAVFS